MNLTAADIIAITSAGNAVRIHADGSIEITPATSKKEGNAERCRRYRVSKHVETMSEHVESMSNHVVTCFNTTLPSPPPLLSPTPPILPAPTPELVQVSAHTHEAAADLFAIPKLAPAYKRVLWSPELGWQGITEGDRGNFQSAAPAVNLDRQLSAADLWLRANPAKAKKQNFYRFFVNWIARQQERGGDTPTTNKNGNHQPTARPAFTRNVVPLDPNRPDINATAWDGVYPDMADAGGPGPAEDAAERDLF